MNLPRYHCHKDVSAAKIAEVRIVTTAEGTHGELVPADPQLVRIDVAPEFLATRRPHPGGYYVRYDDGYESFSPAAAFEAGYTLLEDPSTPDLPLE